MSAGNGQIDWRGVHHLALVTEDMDATVRFWHGVLDARLVLTLATDSFRHYFFEFDRGSTVAFFEYRNQPLETYSKPAGVPYPPASQFDHLSFGVADEDALVHLRGRLLALDCGVSEVVDHDVLRSIYFTDNNGIALEASWWTVDPTDGQIDYEDRRLFSDPDPVPAFDELRSNGTLEWLPRTELVDEITVPVREPG
jgi:catechol 2,3-dioxygenase-like lactoylglutathione lyase family enzyme